MSKVTTSGFYVNNKRVIRAKIDTVLYPCDKIELKFSGMNIVSSSIGVIMNDTITTKPFSHIEVLLEDNGESQCECLISSFTNGTINSESCAFTLPKVYNTFSAKNTQIKKGKNLFVHVSIEHDIVLTIRSTSVKDVCFGIESEDLLASDIVFKVYPDITRIRIPVEAFWSKYQLYPNENKTVTCSEIEKSSNSSISRYFKSTVSNKIKCSDIPACSNKSLIEFYTPTGKNFDAAKWKINDISGVPVYMGEK